MAMRRASGLVGSPRVRAFAAGVLGFLAYGTWGWWVNAEFGQMVGVRAGLVQGSYSFLLTFTSTLLVEWLFERMRGCPWPVVSTTALTSLMLFLVAYGVQFAVGTPQVLLTILPGFLIGSCYTAVYVVALAKLSL